MSQGPAPERNGEGGSPEPAAEVIREIQGLVDKACHAHDRGDFERSAALAGEALGSVGLYAPTGEQLHAPPPPGSVGALPAALQPFIGRALALEATRVLGLGDGELAFGLAREAATVAPGSYDIFSALRTIVRDNATRGELSPDVTFMQLDSLAAAGVTYLAAAHGIVAGHAPMNLVATRDHHRIRVQREIETVVRDHLAAAEQVRSNGRVAGALCEAGAHVGLAGLSLVGLPDLMAGLTDLYRHDLSLGLAPDTPSARSTALLLEAIGLSYHRADIHPFALVTLALAVKLDPHRTTAFAVLETLRREFAAEKNLGGEELSDRTADRSRWIAYRAREIPLGWNFGVRGNSLFADAFYRVRELEPFTIDLAREVAHDYAIIDRGGALAAELFVRAAEALLDTVRDSTGAPIERLVEGLRAQFLLRYIESRREISREVIKPAHHLAGEFERLVAEVAYTVPPGVPADAETFFRVIRSHHSG